MKLQDIWQRVQRRYRRQASAAAWRRKLEVVREWKDQCAKRQEALDAAIGDQTTTHGRIVKMLRRLAGINPPRHQRRFRSAVSQADIGPAGKDGRWMNLGAGFWDNTVRALEDG